MTFDKERMQQLLEALEEEERSHKRLPAGLDMNIGLVWGDRWNGDTVTCGSAGCIGGLTWLLAGGQAPSQKQPYIGYWSNILPVAVLWLKGENPLEDPKKEEILVLWDRTDEPPLFNSDEAYALVLKRLVRTGNNAPVSAADAAEAVRRVIKAGDLNFNPWKAMMEELG